MRCLKQLKSLWIDDRGSSDFMALMLITAVVSLAGLVGLVQIRDQVTQQFGDVAVALDHVDQSFSYTITIASVGYTATASYADPAPTLTDPVDAAPACLTLNLAPTGGEGTPAPTPTGAFP